MTSPLPVPASHRQRRAIALALVLAVATAGTASAWSSPDADAAVPSSHHDCDARTDDGRTTPAVGRRAMVATAHPAASEAGCRVLADGGTAADAAVAVQAVLSVVEPQSSGLAGGTVVTYYDRSADRVRFFDGLSAAPGEVTAGLRTPTTQEQAQLGVTGFPSDVTYTGRAVGVPGTVAVLDLVHDRFGTTDWAGLFDPAIELANDGFEMAPYLVDTLDGTAAGLARCGYPDLAARYCEDGAPLSVGTVVTNPALADVLAEVAAGGADAFYDPDGTIAPAIVERASRGPYRLEADADGPAVIPSLVTAEDFGAYDAIERDPLCRDVLLRRVCAAPPPSFGGIAVLSMLGYLERGDVRATAPESLERMHLGIEASRIVQFDRREYVGDPDFRPVPTAGLLDEAYLDERFGLFSPTAAIPVIAPGQPPMQARSDGGGTPVAGPDDGADTTSNVSIVDDSGDALSMTTTINSSFGAQVEARGMALNNVQENFTRPDSISPGQQVNQMEPHKRPRTSITPSLVFRHNGRLELVVGAAGGGAIPDYVTQTIVGVVVDRLDPQAAINQGHWGGQEITSSCPDVIGARSELEEGTGVAGLLDDLQALGHPCARLDDLQSGLTAIQLRSPRHLLGASDPRRDGAAIGD